MGSKVERSHDSMVTKVLFDCLKIFQVIEGHSNIFLESTPSNVDRVDIITAFEVKPHALSQPKSLYYKPSGFCAVCFFSPESPPEEVAPLTVSPAPLVVSLTVLVRPVVVSPTVFPRPPTMVVDQRVSRIDDTRMGLGEGSYQHCQLCQSRRRLSFQECLLRRRECLVSQSASHNAGSFHGENSYLLPCLP